MTATIISVTIRGGQATGSVRVNDGDGLGPKEYVATVPATDAAGNALAPAQIKAALIAAWQAQRAARPQPPVDLTPQVGGTVNL